MHQHHTTVDKLFISDSKNDTEKQFTNLLEQKLGPHTFQTWFSSAQFSFSDDNNLLCVTSLNSFISDFVEQNYASTILNTAYELTHNNYEAKFSISGQAQDTKIVSEITKAIQTVQRSRQTPQSARLVPTFTFENFVTGSNSEFAYTSALAVAEAPGRTNFNPLFIYGKTGLGKTHLLQAIGHFALSEETADKILYVTSNQFFDDYVHYVHEIKKSQEFYSRYKNIDILLIDDIQFLSNKWETQNQFYRIFEALTAEKKQIIITSDRHPNEIKDMKTRLLNRFSGGLLVDIQPPGYETRMAILKKKAEQNGIHLPGDVLETIANCPTQNVRELDGLLIKVIAYSNFTGHDITVDLIRQVLGDAVNMMRAPITLDHILSETAKEFDISKNKLCALSRAREVAIPRQICMYLCKVYTQNSLATIGVAFNRNHSTVIHAIKKCEEILESDPELTQRIKNIERNLGKR